jgi:hypothetical protein
MEFQRIKSDAWCPPGRTARGPKAAARRALRQPPSSTEAGGKPVRGWELVGSRLMRFAKVEACRQARIASINGLTPADLTERG